MSDTQEKGKGKRDPNEVPEGTTRRFKCIRGCYWDSTRFWDEHEAKTPSTVEFTGPTKIPATFQFENWQEY